jgi:hypothetical protein
MFKITAFIIITLFVQQCMMVDMLRHFNDHIILLREEDRAHKTSLTPQCVIEVSVPTLGE